MDHPFLVASRPVVSPDGRHHLTFDASWVQGRGVYGGVVSAVVVNAIRQVVDPRRRLRALSLSFCAPAKPGPATVRTRLVREGAWVSTVAAELENSDGVVATAIATCAAPRPLPDGVTDAVSVRRSTCPDVPRPETLDPVPIDLPLLPTYARHFELRFALGDPPGSSGAPRVGVWLRFRDAGVDVADEAVAVALLDALPPALLSTLPAMRPAASVEWHVQFFSGLPRPLERGEDLLVTAETWMAEEGYAEELDQLWTKDGVLLAQAHQTIALL